MKFVQLALLSAATLAVAQPHNHVHRHKARKVQGRDAAATTTTVAGPVVTVYELDGVVIPWSQVEAGIDSGVYVLVGDTISTVAAPSTSSSVEPSTTSISTSTTPTPTPSSTSTSTSQLEAQFLEVSTSTSKTSTSTSVTPTTTSTTEVQKATTGAPATTSSSTSSGSGSGVTASFPNGTLDCSTFPSDYGAVASDWLNLGGWTGIQLVPHYTPGDSSISYIETATSGGCVANSFCSYACPAGYQKSQWPYAQGSTGQSIGGLYCNSHGKLVLRDSTEQLCTAGVGGVQASNSLSKNVAICRTDYPGTESETVALNVAAGATVEVTCPDASDYFFWEGSATSAQYYINPSGYSVSEACIWGSAGTNLGNWAPVNMGVGKGLSGVTYISLFPNSPTNPDGVLDFKIQITGGVSGSCSYSGGTYYSNGVESATGCTVAVTGTATFEFS
jgi:hypothetical protein